MKYRGGSLAGVATNIILSWQKFCRGKHVFVTTKIILVAASASDGVDWGGGRDSNLSSSRHGHAGSLFTGGEQKEVASGTRWILSPHIPPLFMMPLTQAHGEHRMAALILIVFW